MTPYVGRLAPSPTGLLHLGHARTFWAAYERAQAAGGRLWLRDEDLDTQRSKPEFSAAMKEDLLWLGVAWEGEVRQSERLGLYRDAMLRLIALGLAYPCTCSRKELASMVAAPHEDTDDEPVYTGKCRPPRIPLPALRHDTPYCPPERSPRSEVEGPASPLPPMPAAALESVNYRFRVPDGEVIRFVDEHAGPQKFVAGCDAGADFGDFLVWRKDGLPSYQLACVVDDAAMGITEVVRGRDLLKSTARQLLLQRALGFAAPAYFHCDLMRDDQGVRLAKRHDALSLRTLREQGWTPEQVRQHFGR